MRNTIYKNLNFKIPEGFIVFISGVPGVGKSTIAYELLKMFNEFRIVEETDLIREILHGYNEYIQETFKEKVQFIFEEIEIAQHTRFLQYDEAKEQCEYMKNSIEKIVYRQKRKGISTIINGVHIVPEVLNGLCENDEIIFLNLFIDNKTALYNRWKDRETEKYTSKNLITAFETNLELSFSTKKLSKETRNVFLILM